MKVKPYILAILMLVGCATGNYQSYNGGIGYQNTKINSSEYLVTYTGTSTTNIEKVNDFALLRSAELTLESGYKYFVINDAKNNRDLLRSSRNTSTEVAIRDNSMPSMPGTWAGSSSPKAKSELSIQMHNSQSNGNTYDAKMTRKSILDKYAIENEDT
jgi:hypothetical protein